MRTHRLLEAALCWALLVIALSCSLGSRGPRPGPTGTPSLTATAWPTATPRPSPQPTRTPVPTIVPPGWVSYTSMHQTFSVCYPGSWRVTGEGMEYVELAVSRTMYVSLQVAKTDCFARLGFYDLPGVSNCFAGAMAQASSPTFTQRIVESGYWEGGPFAGLAQAIAWHSAADNAGHVLYQIIVPLDEEWAFTASYGRLFAAEVGEEERQVLRAVVGTLRTGVNDLPASMVADSLRALETAAAGGAGAMPRGWVSYTAPSGLFSVSYPGWWCVVPEDAAGPAELVVPAPLDSSITFGVQTTGCFEGSAPGLEGLDCFASEQSEAARTLFTCKVVGKGLWDDGVHRGYRLETTCRPNSVTDTHAKDVGSYQVILPLGQRRAFVVWYGRARPRKLTQQEEQLLAAVVRSLRVG